MLFSPNFPKRLLTVLVFIVVVLAIDRGAAYICQQVTLRSEIRFSRLYRGGEPRSLLIIGDSRGVNGFYSPLLSKSLNIPVINLSYNGMSMEIAEALFLDYLDHNSNPLMIILEITNLNASNNLINDLKMFSGQSTRLEIILKKENYKVAVACQLSHLYRYNSELFFRVLYYLNKSDQKWINHRTINPEIINKLSHEPNDKTSFDSIPEENIQTLLNILHHAYIRNIPVKLVISPYLPSFIKKINNYQNWKSKIQRRVGDNCSIYDYSVAVSKAEYFADRVHLNFRGSQYFLTKLFQDGIFQIIH